MSSVPSIRVDCSQCKRGFWVKLKKGIIPSVIVACPNCEFAWDLEQYSTRTIVQRSYAWDEFITRIARVFQPQKALSNVEPDESVEQFREANTSSDSADWHLDLLELHAESLVELEVESLEDVEIIAFVPEEISEELVIPLDETPLDVPEPSEEETPEIPEDVLGIPEEQPDDFEDMSAAMEDISPPNLPRKLPRLPPPNLPPISAKTDPIAGPEDET